MNTLKPTSCEDGLSLLQPVLSYFRDYVQLVKVEGIRGFLSVNLLLWSILAVANSIDIYITYTVFSKGGFELNPAMAFLCSKFGNLSLAFYKGILLGVLFVLLPFIKLAYQKFLIFACFAYIVLVISHAIRF